MRLQATLDDALLPLSHQMKLHWQIGNKDVVRVKALVAGQTGSALIRARQQHNLAKAKPAVTKERFWRAAVFASRDSVAWTDDNVIF